MRKLSIIAVAVSILCVAPMLSAAEHTSLHSSPRPFVPTTATSPGIIVNSITIGEPDGQGQGLVLPCWNCVSGASVASLGLAGPLSLVPTGSALRVVLTADDVAFSGAVTFTYAIRTSTTAPPIQTGNFSADVYPSLWWGYFDITTPSTPGRYLLQGTIIQGNAVSVANTSLLVE
jgi:hypothetical protein